MSNRKNNNSALILATLGVYLGLVLVGATPQVLAQAAMTKQFNVKDEIEHKDDLDKKPGGCNFEKVVDYETTFLWFNRKSIPDYADLVRRVLEAYPEEVDGIDVSWRSVGDVRPLRKVATTVAYPFGFLEAESSEDLDGDVLFAGTGFAGMEFRFSVFRNNFETQFRFESQQIPYDTPLVRALYSSALDLYRCSPYNSGDLILRNTELTVVGDHLMINTRLPRGSLKSLLANDAK